MHVPKDVNHLTWDEILETMGRNFGCKTFVIRERYRFYTETKRKPCETVQEFASRAQDITIGDEGEIRTHAGEPNGLARWANTLSHYDYVVEYRPTKDHSNADLLSRLPVGPDSTFDLMESSADHDVICSINYIGEKISKSNPELIIDETRRDPVLQEVIRMVENGWNNTPDGKLKEYNKIQNSLFTENNCLYYGNRLVIPNSCRKRILESLHTGHFGVQRMKSLARTSVYWPGIDSDITLLCRECHLCDLYRNKLPQAPNHPWEPETEPWVRIHVDHAINFMGFNWLIIVDAYSKYPCVHKTTSTSTAVTIKFLEQDFSHFGIPHQIVSDNATTFSSGEFRDWCTKKSILHLTGSPYHPSTNGTAERFVQTFKRALQKSKLPPDDALCEFLLQYRRTPGPSGISPGELLQGRKLRSHVDTFHPIAAKERPKEIVFPARYNFIRENSPCYIFNTGYRTDKTSKCLPWKILRVLGCRNVEVEFITSGEKGKRNIDQIRPRTPVENDTDFPLYLPVWNQKTQEETNIQEVSADARQIPRRYSRIKRPPTLYITHPWKRYNVSKTGRCYGLK
ncbi:Transposon Tf2-11 polyprotein [Thelohanellus kitauei]|uniref:Transposon Tf2-11 polyprotein n=1 Tax=Thelohanellus kitauei TaxID=669202 RepID=A0A0C2NBC7_THEKT|nr:Transposon Tf2-11 polyprotein [Thelohanellus kitauei]